MTNPLQAVATITTIWSAAQNVINIVANIETVVLEAKQIYNSVASYMDAFLANNGLTGKQKKEIVLAMIRDGWKAITSNFKGFTDTVELWYDRISAFIDKVYTVYKDTVRLALELKDQLNSLKK